MRHAIACALALIFFACATTPRESYVSGSVVRGPYIDAVLTVPEGDWRFLFPNDEGCARMLKVESPVAYTSRGPFGSASAPDGTVCDPLGVASLQRWRRRQGRVVGEMAPASPARWEVIHEDREVYLLRGRFAVASRLGLANTFDSVMMVPNDAQCSPIVTQGNATLQFHQTGSRVLVLGGCPVTGVATPPPPQR